MARQFTQKYCDPSVKTAPGQGDKDGVFRIELLLGGVTHSTAHEESVSTNTANDTSASLAGWRTTVSPQTVSGPDAAQLASTRPCVSPHPTTLVVEKPADGVRSSPCACAGPEDLMG